MFGERLMMKDGLSGWWLQGMSDEERVRMAAVIEAQNDALLEEYFSSMPLEKQQVRDGRECESQLLKYAIKLVAVQKCDCSP